MVHFDPLVKKMSDASYLSGPLRKRKFSSMGSKGHCLWFVIGGFRSVLWVSVFQGSLLVILLWPKPDVNIPNIFDRFHPWTSDFQISMRQKYWRFRLTLEIVKVRLSALCKQSFLSHMPLTLYKTFTWQTFASLHLFSSLVYVSTYCVPIAHLHQNKPFPLLYLGRTQIINIQYLLYVDRFMPRFPCLFRGKYLLENAGNGISECLGFKIFWETVPPDPPRRLLFQHNLLLKNLLKALHIHN